MAKANKNKNKNKKKQGITSLLAVVTVLGMVYQLGRVPPGSPGSTASSKRLGSCAPRIGLRPLQKRDEIGAMLEDMGLKTGVEVGVQHGEFSATTLEAWKSCEEFHLVDLWAHQENYEDIANFDDNTQQDILKKAQATLKPWEDITRFHRMLSTEAAAQIPKDSLDYAYIDARHDYCGVTEDLEAYWPLIKPGGIMAGHDYMTNAEVQSYTPEQDWSICHDGTKEPRAVRGAVEDFFRSKGISISVAYREPAWNTWVVQKPLC